MSDEPSAATLPPDAQALLREVHIRFRNAPAAFSRLTMYSLLMFLPAQAVATGHWYLVGAMMLVLCAISSLAWFGIFWRELAGFRRYFVVQASIAWALAVARYFTPSLWPVVVALAASATLIWLMIPALREFCRRFELPGLSRSAINRLQ
jgi:hypothetical protein